MGPFEAIGLVAVVGGFIAITILIGTMFKRFMAYKERRLAVIGEGRAGQVERLEARVRVLERIATAKDADLAQQIEALRGPLPASAQLETEERI